MSVVKRELNLQTWEDSEFPTVCDACLGANPRIRMQKEPFGAECKVCLGPFSTFRWCAGVGSRFQKTLICQTCAKSKNVCQCCILDLKYGLPVQVRDQMLGIEDETPKLETNRQVFYHSRALKHRAATQAAAATTSYAHRVGSHGSVGKEALVKIAAFLQQNQQELAKYRNAPYICSFFVKGECNRGSACPYSHDLLASSEQNRTKIMNRYFGQKDPVAEKILQQTASLIPPAFYDTTICSVCIHNVQHKSAPHKQQHQQPTQTQATKKAQNGQAADACRPVRVTEDEVRRVFGRFGDIRSVVFVAAEAIAFVNFLQRKAADAAVEEFLEAGVPLADAMLAITWAYARPKGPAESYDDDAGRLGDPAPPATQGRASPQAAAETPDDPPADRDAWLLPGSAAVRYAAADAKRLGSVVRTPSSKHQPPHPKRPK